jgi:hypothetical protein
MKTLNYTDAKGNRTTNIDPGIFNQLSPMDKQLAKRHLLCKIIGKLHRHVPLLFPDFLCEAIDLLIEKRGKIGIPDSNSYLFAKPDTNNFLNPWTALRAHTAMYELERPDLITSTRLRKHMATSIQVCMYVLYFLVLYTSQTGPVAQ